MEDKDRVELVIKDKGLLNNVFCEMTGIAPASLSHILSGRSKPTLPVLRNIVSAFPDINPVWMFLGEGEMYLNGDVNMNPGSSRDDSLYVSNNNGSLLSSDESLKNDGGYSAGVDIFSISSSGSAVENHRGAGRSSFQSEQRPVNTSSQFSHVEFTDIVRETVSLLQKPQRKIIEVRIFFDDGTYESFSAK